MNPSKVKARELTRKEAKSLDSLTDELGKVLDKHLESGADPGIVVNAILGFAMAAAHQVVGWSPRQTSDVMADGARMIEEATANAEEKKP